MSQIILERESQPARAPSPTVLQLPLQDTKLYPKPSYKFIELLSHVVKLVGS